MEIAERPNEGTAETLLNLTPLAAAKVRELTADEESTREHFL